MSLTTRPQQWTGTPLLRREDLRLLTGRGAYIDDLRAFSHALEAAILRSPYAHAHIRSIDASAARKLPGVLDVLTGPDLAAVLQPLPVAVPNPPRYYPLAVDRVRYVGEPVAVVIAENRYIAEDALDLIEVDYEPLPAVVDPEAALEPSAAVLHDHIGNNVAWHRQMRFGEADAAFAAADHVVKIRSAFPRYSSTPLETYGLVADYDPTSGLYTVWANFQGPFTLHAVICKALGCSENQLRLHLPRDIGGGFGIKMGLFPYIALFAAASRRVGRPVKWIEDRLEHMKSSASATDRVTEMEAAVRCDGRILALKARIVENVGAYIRPPEPGCFLSRLSMFTGPYQIADLAIDITCVHTNKMPTGPNRGYGAPQHNHALEGLVDRIAASIGLDPAEVRRRNLIPPHAFPYVTPTGGVYDSGDYPALLEMALEQSQYRQMRQEQAAARAEGRIVGVGLTMAVDPSASNMGYITVAVDPEDRAAPGYLPKSGAQDSAVVRMGPMGDVTVQIATAAQGQGHETAAAQLAADALGLHVSQVAVVNEFDTYKSLWSISSGNYSSRFAAATGSAVIKAAQVLAEKLKRIAAHMLGVDASEITLAGGQAHHPQTGRSTSIRRIAGLAHWHPAGLPPGEEPGLHALATFNFDQAQPPELSDRVNSCSVYGVMADVAVVEIDPRTGKVMIRRYVTCHDAGRILNPLLVDGQVRGGFLHGMAGALYEEMVYDPETGQLLTGSWMDYLCPTASEMPALEIHHMESPSPFALSGAKGVGEATSMTAPAAIANAVNDALAPHGIRIDSLPIVPAQVWELLRHAVK